MTARRIVLWPVGDARHAPATGPVAGWVGRSGNLPYLAALAAPLREVARRHEGFRLMVVADKEPRLPGIEVEFRRWSLESEVSCFDGIGVGLTSFPRYPYIGLSVALAHPMKEADACRCSGP